MIDLTGTFDSTNALSGMFLWLIFGYLTALLNCDLQRFLTQHPAWIHAFGLTAFFFLFTLLDSKNKTSLGVLWIKTFFIYLLFVLMTKSKWYFVVPVLVLLLIDQSLKKNIAIKEGNNEPVDKSEHEQLISFINMVVLVVIIVGTIHYYMLQKAQHKTDFRLSKFFFGIKDCKPK